MRIYIATICSLLVLAACKQSAGSKNDPDAAAVRDTIRTGTGLKYIYLKKGNGPKIEDGSKVSVYNRLYLNDSDKVFWSTEQSVDSVFTFILGKTSLIRGANELYPRLRQGDEVIAIMPDSIAYGKTGSNGIPPMTTLVFNPIRIKNVSPPKLVLSDTLYKVASNQGSEAAIAKYKEISVKEPDSYHLELELLYDLLDLLASEREFEKVKTLSEYFEKQASSRENMLMFGYFKVVATEQLGDMEAALKFLDAYIERFPEESFFVNYRNQLVNRVGQSGATQ